MPKPVPSARPNTRPAPSVSSEPGMKHTVVKTYTRAKARAPSPGLSSTHSRKDVRVSATKPRPGTWKAQGDSDREAAVDISTVGLGAFLETNVIRRSTKIVVAERGSFCCFPRKLEVILKMCPLFHVRM